MSKASLRRLLLFALGFLILLWMIRAAGPHVLWQNLCVARWWILALVAVWGVGYVLNAASWAAIIRALGTSPQQNCGAQSPPTLSFWRIWRFTVSGFAINYITPFGLLGGEPYRVWVLRPYVGLERATGSVLLYLMMHVCSHFVFWIAAALAALSLLHPAAGLRLGLWAVVVVMAALVWLFFRGWRRGMVRSFFRTVSRWPLVGGRVGAWREKHREQLRRIDEAVTALLLRHPHAFWRSLGLEFLSRVVNCLEVALILRLLVPDAAGPLASMPGLFFVSLFIVAFSSLFANLLFFSPLQMGTREGGIFLAMQCLRLPVAASALMPLAVSVSILTRIREFIWIAIGLLLAIPARRGEG